ncbi:MAG: hypothetical protein L0338_15095 [Acidobacteria bacterium]|nr:hypothetical protein [Acidobacteriota bacterium]
MSAPTQDSSLRLRLWASLLLFISAYSPLLLILVVQDFDPETMLPKHPWLAATLLFVAGLSVAAILHAVREVQGGLVVEISKASNKSGEMFGYTIPYVLSFLRVDLGSWQMMLCLLIFLGMTFAIAYRTQTVFVNPVLAVAGYMLIDCTFKRGSVETQAMVLSNCPLSIGGMYRVERLSHYLYVAVPEREVISSERQ